MTGQMQVGTFASNKGLHLTQIDHVWRLVTCQTGGRGNFHKLQRHSTTHKLTIWELQQVLQLHASTWLTASNCPCMREDTQVARKLTKALEFRIGAPELTRVMGADCQR